MYIYSVPGSLIHACHTPAKHFRRTRRFSTAQTGLTFLAVGLGVFLAGGTAVWCDFHFYQPVYREAAAAAAAGDGTVVLVVTAPENRLYVSMLGCFGVPVGIFWFAWSARASVHWASCVVAAVPFAWGNLCIFVSRRL